MSHVFTVTMQINFKLRLPVLSKLYEKSDV